ncbi:MAG: glycosyltransferase family 2 protein [Gammaproteobacteria bacterium]
MAACLFWLSALVIGYTYLGYPILLWILARVKPRPVVAADITPTVSVIVAAYNEEGLIAGKISGLLAQDYPPTQMEIIVASDGSTDATDAVVTAHAGVKLVRVEGRQGKSAAQNAAVEVAHGEILVFTDATTVIANDGIRKLVRSFGDSTVGCVGTKLTYVSKGGSATGAGGSSYWNYERWIKTMESTVNSLIGVSGCFYGVRKGLYEKIPPNLISDFTIALVTYEKGFRVVYEEGAQSFEETLEDSDSELSMRVRVAVRTYAALWAKRHLLNPFRYGLFAFQLISHKVLRYAVSAFLVTLFLANIALMGRPTYQATFLLQAGFYLGALAGYRSQRQGSRRGFLDKPYYFALANLAAVIALFRFLCGDHMVTWTPMR